MKAGGKVFRGSDQGCAFWPSVWPEDTIGDQTTVTKVFFTVGADLGLQNEVAGYGIFHKYDPNNIFHARLKEHGECFTDVAIDNGCERGYIRNKITKYINTEYVGTSLKEEQVRTREFKIDLISFFIGLLSVRDVNNNCLICPDLNGGNICYVYNADTEKYIFKCIDVGGVIELDATAHIEAENIAHINNQFSNIHYLVNEGLRNFTIPEFTFVAENNYEDNLAPEIQKLQDALDYVTATDEIVLFKNQFETATSSETILSKPKKPKFRSIFDRDDSDEEGHPLPSFRHSNSKEGPPLTSSSFKMFSDDEED